MIRKCPKCGSTNLMVKVTVAIPIKVNKKLPDYEGIGDKAIELIRESLNNQLEGYCGDCGHEVYARWDKKYERDKINFYENFWDWGKPSRKRSQQP